MTGHELTDIEQNASPKFYDTTIRQTIKLDLPRDMNTCKLRLRFSNAFGLTPLNITEVSVALPFNNSAGTSLITTNTNQIITFNRGEDRGTLIPPAALAVSDPFDFDFAGINTYPSNGTTEAGSTLSISIYLAEGQQGEGITSHPGSRTTSFLGTSNQIDAANITGNATQSLAHWYFISAVEVWAPQAASTLVLIGDSITDGRGSDTNLNNRWPDPFFTRLRDSNLSFLAVANQAAGGNRILADGLGPSVLSRIDRDVLSHSGVRYAMIFEGVNDIGTADPSPANQTILYHQLIAAYRQIISRIHAQGIPIFGATITPFGSPNTTIQPYSDPIREQTRLKINQFIRTSGEFDGVVDFDAIVRDPANQTMLNPEYNSGDYLHLNVAGYQAMANAVPLSLFETWRLGYSGL